MKTWQLFIRHAHRSTEDRELDNGLSEKGRKQGAAVVQYLKEFAPHLKPAKVFTSPKLRCQETAKYVADWAGVEVEIDVRLDEQGPWESESAFRQRLDSFYQEARLLKGNCYVSHGDVLPFILELASYPPIQIKKAGLFSLENGQLRLHEAVHSSGN